MSALIDFAFLLAILSGAFAMAAIGVHMWLDLIGELKARRQAQRRRRFNDECQITTGRPPFPIV